MGPHCLLGAEMCTPSSMVFKLPHSLAPGYLLTRFSAPCKAAKALATLDGLCFRAHDLHAWGLPLCSLKFIASPPVPKSTMHPSSGGPNIMCSWEMPLTLHLSQPRVNYMPPCALHSPLSQGLPWQLMIRSLTSLSFL